MNAPTALVLFAAVVACTPAIDFQPESDRYTKCGARADAPTARDNLVTITGTIRQIADETPVDGPVRLVVIDATGQPRKLYFGSLLTRPGPSEQRKSTYRAIAASKEGDCVQVRGTTMADGQVWLHELVNFDR